MDIFMNKWILIRKSFLFQLLLIFGLQGCGGSDSENDWYDEPETEEEEINTETGGSSNTLSSNIWMTASCAQDENGVYFKSLFEFKADGQILYGYQDFQDASCTTATSETALPSSLLTTYTTGNTSTLQDGTSGTLITIAFTENNISTTVDGYYRITDQNTLCFSHNFAINTGRFEHINGPAEPMDYENCLTVHSVANGSNQNPNPNPNPQSGNLLGAWLLPTRCIAYDDGGTFNIMYQYTEDNRLLIAPLSYESDNCSGDGSGSMNDFIDTDPPTTYTELGEETLPNGTQGFKLRFSDNNGNVDGFYVIDNQQRVCLSYNLGLTDSNSTDIDYENCLVKLDQ
jgi:hypothetical protein